MHRSVNYIIYIHIIYNIYIMCVSFRCITPLINNISNIIIICVRQCNHFKTVNRGKMCRNSASTNCLALCMGRNPYPRRYFRRNLIPGSYIGGISMLHGFVGLYSMYIPVVYHRCEDIDGARNSANFPLFGIHKCYFYPGDHLTKAYGVTIQSYRKLHTKIK